jgi:hypothetical protein
VTPEKLLAEFFPDIEIYDEGQGGIMVGLWDK